MSTVSGWCLPGAALSLLVIWQLPFPPQDPLLEARRREAVEQGLDPLTAVDYPEMGLRLKQGCGRLIRTRCDRGAIAILEPARGKPWEQVVIDALPAGALIVHSLDGLSERVLRQSVNTLNRQRPMLLIMPKRTRARG